MFDNNVFIEGSLKNVKEDDRLIGYEMQTYITYYRGIPLSMVNFFAVEEDGVPVPSENIRVAVDEYDWFTLEEMKTVSTVKWEYGAPAVIRVLKEGGLCPGEHKIKLTVCTRTAYIPFPLEGSMERTVVIN